MLYEVTVTLNGHKVASCVVRGFDLAKDIETYYAAQSDDYRVDIEPDVYGYLKEHSNANYNSAALAKAEAIKSRRGLN